MSIFTRSTNQPAPLTKASTYQPKQYCYFTFGDESTKILQQSGFEEPWFWQYILNNITENHIEGHALKNTLADTFSVYTMGAQPIQISMNGYLQTTMDMDHRVDFLNIYHNKIRGTNLEKNRLEMVFVLKDTTMRLRIRNINVGNSSQISDMTRLAINGIGYKYKVHGVNIEYQTSAMAESNPDTDNEIEVV